VIGDELPAGGPRSKNRRLIFRSPSSLQSLGLIVLGSAALALLFAGPDLFALRFLDVWLAVFLLPPLLAAGLTGPLAHLLGGRLTTRRSLLLSLTVTYLILPIALVWRAVAALDPAILPPLAAGLLFAQGPVLWLRHMSLFGVSRPSHARSLPPSLLAPLLALPGIFLLRAPSPALVVEGALYLLVGFLAAALLLRAADRPMEREFGASGVSLIRPMLDHINERDPQATEQLERFFSRFSQPADLSVRLVIVRGPSGIKATIALPTVHPGPFGELGSSNLPERLAGRLGDAAGLVLVPHTPCTHDQDLPSGREFDRVAAETQDLFDALAAAPPSGAAPVRASPLVAGVEGGLARVQLLGDTAITLVTQAPDPTDDIDFAVVDPVVRQIEGSRPVGMALIDAHNSYVEDQGDLNYGTPLARRLAGEIEASVDAALKAARVGPIRAGVAHREGYSLGTDGIGPHGIRVLVLEAAGTRTAYILIDGNNLVVGARAKLLEAVRGVVDVAEVMTTDNHIVHAVDGGTNPVGERYPVDQLARDVRVLTEAAVADLAPAEVRSGRRPIPAVRVLLPGWTARLLTSLGDTFSMFTNALLMTFLLVITASLVVLIALH
jgi:putative membrane protein